MFILFLFYIGAIVLGWFMSAVGVMERKIIVIVAGFSISCITFYLALFTILGIFAGNAENILSHKLYIRETIISIIGLCAGIMGMFLKNRLLRYLLIIIGYTAFLSATTLFFLLPYLVHLIGI